MSIPLEDKQAVISAGVEFVRAVTQAYGADEGLALWDKLNETLDPDLKGQVFFAMITGEYSDKITLQHSPGLGNRVAAIKAVRTWTGMGLKEAKDVIDAVAPYNGTMPKSQSITLLNPRDRMKAIVDLRQTGVMI